jgi:3-oxoacyl-[acyl-carrier-protein] synthase-3
MLIKPMYFDPFSPYDGGTKKKKESMRRSVVVSTGSYLPEKVMTNNDLAKIVDTSDEWIFQRTGIRQRHVAAEGEKTSHMATKAAQKALEAAKLTASDIDAIFLATATPDQAFPATAVTVQDNLGMGARGFAFDLQAVCSGFIYALATADNFIKAGQIRRALVIGAEHFTRLLDWTDRGTCVLFGDGAGAVVLEAGEGKGTKEDRGILSTHLHSEGAQRGLLYADPKVVMNGKEVFRHAVHRMSEVVTETLEANGISPSEIKFLVPHQANKRIIDSTAEKLHLPPEKVILTVGEHGNTSAASIPLALDSGVRDGRIVKGDLILTEALGGGLTWGAALIRM